MSFLQRLLGPDPAARARLELAAAAVDRELAANIELSSMFDQTHQAVIFENGEFTRHAAALEAADAAFALVSDVYRRIPPTEDAMERRGPANSLRPDDRLLIEAWEGDAREAQRALRAALAAPPPSGWALLLVRLLGKRQIGR
jgi:hypothetical protein